MATALNPDKVVGSIPGSCEQFVFLVKGGGPWGAEEKWQYTKMGSVKEVGADGTP